MNELLSFLSSDIAIIIYLSIAIIFALFLIVKYTKRLKNINKQAEIDAKKSRDDNLYQSLLNEKREKE